MGKSLSHSNNIFVGIDIAKDKFDVAFSHNNQVIEYKNNKEEEVKKLLKHLKEIQPKLICFEATGTYWRLLMYELQRAPQPCSMINPQQIRDHAKAQGKLAKSDKIDARIIVDFAKKKPA